MQLDTVVTIAIGRNGSKGTLTDKEWKEFQYKTLLIVKKYSVVVAHTEGAGIGSDDNRENIPEDSAVIVAINPSNSEKLRKALSMLLPKYGQSSAAFAIDSRHEPVFATATGYRA